MDCKKNAVIKFSEEEIEEFKRIVNSNDYDTALKIISKIDKKITEFLEPH